jgi:AcrR family transcriptional regulator
VELSAAPDSVRTVVDRALERQKSDVTREVEAILEATLRVAERAAPAPPRVADIVAEAGTSNQAFYRYFRGKDDLMNAVMQRGLARLHSYLAHLVGREEDPRAQVTAWIRGVLTQVTDRTAARQSAAVTRQVERAAGRRGAEVSDALDRLADMLVEPLERVGSTHPEQDARLVQELTFAIINRHFQHDTVPDGDEREHLIAFCLRGVGPDGAQR